jgi:hypothetical protein
MDSGSLALRDYPADMVRLSCAKCGRSGQYRKQTLIERYGADIRLPDLRVAPSRSYMFRSRDIGMAIQFREIYRSAPNGDRWLLARSTETGRVFVSPTFPLAVSPLILRSELFFLPLTIGQKSKNSCG